ncbi:hypothetical protein [Pseudescherichia sp.]|uniref:hypothetical protein n=1 Tax=Pseudescherichia sp. TaxID=2055881 RepID=UPI0028B00C2D|nr:hypothetical protein [Pseudescherichia sp.]
MHAFWHCEKRLFNESKIETKKACSGAKNAPDGEDTPRQLAAKNYSLVYIYFFIDNLSGFSFISPQ